MTNIKKQRQKVIDLRSPVVLAIYVKGKFHRYLKKSEVRFVSQLCSDFGEITVKLTPMTTIEYDLHFNS